MPRIRRHRDEGDRHYRTLAGFFLGSPRRVQLLPPPTFSFSFKGKIWPRSHGTSQITIADIAKALGVTYVLDGSVRKAGARVRVAARLIRADSGYVVWSETYDRPFDDILMVQDDIAGEVTK